MPKLAVAWYMIFVGSGVCGALQRLSAAEVAWTMAVIPDTQNYRNADAAYFNAMTQWLVDNKDARNIQLAAGVGDITGGNLPVDWIAMANAYSTLNGEIPYILVTGNHDYDPVGDDPVGERSNIKMNDYFSLSDNPLNTITTERVAGDLANTYSTLESTDGRKMLLFALEWDTRTEVLDWANSVASQPQFADHTAVLLTHAFIREGHPDPMDNAYRTPDGESVWQALVSQHENFEMVMNGHYLDFNDADPYGPLTTGYLSDIGVAGNTVHAMVFNAQQQPNGGNGYLRLLEFMDDGTTVQVRTYSPTLDIWLTNDRNEFQFRLTPLFSGDFNNNNHVDGADFIAWQLGVGIMNGATFEQGDANHDDAVDGADLDVWQQQYSTVPQPDTTVAATTSTEAVPEPSGAVWVLLILASLAAGLPRNLSSQRIQIAK